MLKTYICFVQAVPKNQTLTLRTCFTTPESTTLTEHPGQNPQITTLTALLNHHVFHMIMSQVQRCLPCPSPQAILEHCILRQLRHSIHHQCTIRQLRPWGPMVLPTWQPLALHNSFPVSNGGILRSMVHSNLGSINLMTCKGTSLYGHYIQYDVI